ncbi:MAG: HEAT repeat domain-containing protein [Solirubrobacterales bacterium]
MMEHLLSGKARAGVAGDLAREFERGYPIDRLFKLLDSEDPEAALSGAFIAQEIGELVAPIADRLCSYLSHPTPWVRSDLLDAIMNSGPPYSFATVSAIESLTTDSDQGIRRKAVAFMATVGAPPAGPQQGGADDA